MKLISFKHREDYGHDWYVMVLHTKRWAVSWNDYAAWPYIQIKSGNGSLLNFMFWAYRFGLDIGIIERTWNWDYLKDIDVEEEDV
jgi:hypothetical protein